MKRKIWKIFKIVLFSLIGLILILVILNAMNFRPIMGLITSSVSSILGREIKSSGFSIGYNDQYGLTVYLYKTEIDNPGWAEKPKMISIGNASVSLTLSKLITGSIKLTNITAENVTIDIIDKGKDQKNYIFSDSSETEPNPEEKPKSQDNLVNINLPQISLHNLVITYESDTRKELLSFQQVNLTDQELAHSQLNLTVNINNVPYIVKGNFGDINNLFDHNGLDAKLEINSATNYINTKLNIALIKNPKITIDAMAEITDMPKFLKSINSGTAPKWSNKLKDLHLTSNLIYENNLLKNFTLKEKSHYKDQTIKLDIQANSQNKSTLYPIQSSLKLVSNANNVLNVKANLDKPYSSTDWLKINFDGGISNLSYFLNKNIPLNTIHYHSKATIKENMVEVGPLKITANVNKKPLTANIWINANITPNQSPSLELVFNAEYEQQMILGANIKINTNNKNNWLILNANGGIRNLSDDLKIFNLKTNYKLTNAEYIIKAVGDKPNHIKAEVQPLNINVNRHPVLTSANFDIDLDSLMSYLNIKTIINGDTGSNLQLKGLIGNPNPNTKWLELGFSTDIKKGNDLSFLAPENKKYFDSIGQIQTQVQAVADKGDIYAVIKPSLIELNKNKLDYSGEFNYGIFQTKPTPLKLNLKAQSNRDKLNIHGEGKLGDKQVFKLSSTGNIQDLSVYNPYFPEVMNVATSTDMSIDNNILSLHTLNFSAQSNDQELNINANGLMDLNKQNVENFQLNGDIANIKINLGIIGQYQPLNLSGQYQMSAKSLSGANQFIDGWGVGIIPVLTDLDLKLSYMLKENHYKMDIDYTASQSDLTATTELDLDKNIPEYKALIKSPIINVKAFKVALDKAKNQQTEYVSNNDKRKASRLVHDNTKSKKSAEEIKAQAQQAIKQEAHTPSWMDQPVSNFLEDNKVNLSVEIEKIIFESNQAENIKLVVQNNIKPDEAKIDIQAEKLFNGRVKSNTTINKIKDVYHIKTDTYIGIVDLNDLARSFYILDGIKKGQFMFNMYGETEGYTVNQFIRILNGKMKIGVNDLKQSLANPQGNIGKFLLLLAGGDWKSGISMKCAIGDFNIVKGVYEINDLLVDTTGAIVLGSGNIDLPEQKVDIILDPKAKYVNLSSLSTAFKIVGNFNNIYFYPDAMSTAKTAALIAGTAALSATGIGLIAVGAVAAGQVGSGVYYANKDFCAASLTPISENQIKQIQESNENLLQNILDGSSQVINDSYEKTFNTGKNIINSGTEKVGNGVKSIGEGTANFVGKTYQDSSDLLKGGLDFFTGDSDNDMQNNN